MVIARLYCDILAVVKCDFSSFLFFRAVPDPDLEIRGRGLSSRPLEKGGPSPGSATALEDLYLKLNDEFIHKRCDLAR